MRTMTAKKPSTEKGVPAKADIERVANAVRLRREWLGLGQDLSSRGGPKRNMVGNLETRFVWPKLPATRARWARALEWEPDAFDRILEGDEPTALDNPGVDPDDLDRAFEALERAISELRHRVQRRR